MQTSTVIRTLVLGTILVAQPAFAQPVGNGLGFRASGGTPQEPSYLLQSESVRKELKLSDAQKAALNKLRDGEESGNHPFFRGLNSRSPEGIQQALEKHAEEIRERVAKILAPEQMNRLNEINMQVVGVDALGFEGVAGKLELTAAQREQLKNLAEDARRRLAELNAQMGSLSPNDAQRQAWKAKQTAIIADRKTGALAVLTVEQRTSFEKLQGEKFDISTVKRNQRNFSRRGHIDAPVKETPSQPPVGP